MINVVKDPNRPTNPKTRSTEAHKVILNSHADFRLEMKGMMWKSSNSAQSPEYSDS